LINFETVQYFCAEEHERTRFCRTLESLKEADVALAKSDVALQLIRSALVLAGMTAQSFLAYYKILNGKLTVGDFVVIQMYQAQLIGPLRMLAAFYTRLTMNWIDVEIVLELLKTEESITEVESPIPADIQRGEIEFRDVCFTYDRTKEVEDQR